MPDENEAAADAASFIPDRTEQVDDLDAVPARRTRSGRARRSKITAFTVLQGRDRAGWESAIGRRLIASQPRATSA
jgi:hypothetical protein